LTSPGSGPAAQSTDKDLLFKSGEVLRSFKLREDLVLTVKWNEGGMIDPRSLFLFRL